MNKVKDFSPIIFGILIIILCIWLMIGTQKECKAKGGTPVGHHNLDCWDNTNKTFIK